MANRLIHESSPYLLQHAQNPVDWYPWGPEALKRAREEDRPILLSIGYAACHWCHVMEHESFENPQIAAIMNEHFVNIKVDREERPDLDGLYMNAVQALTGRGGWPMTMFLTPDGKPFYGGTYFPPVDRGGMPGFPRVLASVVEAFRGRRAELERSAVEISQHLSQHLPLNTGDTELSVDTLSVAASALGESYDARYGGFGTAPKFPQPMTLDFLLRFHRRTGDDRSLSMADHTLERMALGGIYDHLGGGFHRYSTDREWLVPHFEKMLYDNAQLARVYLHAFQLTGKPVYRRIVEETLAYVLREMTSPEGGFYATQDADSEGDEGRFFVWQPREIVTALGEQDARLFNAYYDVSAHGNFAGRSILNIRLAPEVVARETAVTLDQLLATVERGRQTLFAVRERRVKPARDEKVLTSWNGLMLRAFAEAAVVLDRSEYLDVAMRNAQFLLDHVRREDRVLHVCKDGMAKLNGYLEDYAFLAHGLLFLHAAGGGAEWFVWARELAESIIAHFTDPNGGFYDTSDDHEPLVSRPKDVLDNAVPSGNSVATEVFLSLAALTGEQRYRTAALTSLRALSSAMAQHPSAFGELLSALDFATADAIELAIAGAPDMPDTRALLREAWRMFRPNVVVATGSPDAEGVPLLTGRQQLSGVATAYVCRQFVCKLPVTTVSELAKQLDEQV
jgi:uncharacterized protein YyaL (SSP411 family)